ncbi:WXG100 family type VII secretion target [Phytomonospora endophytica]|uniref:Uncharacterized protein YukE n=1 Tax=Phytomonospora endophytica TaxID=714109 RepID=A0A841FVL9_9ACTN|nr:hypothetical protein [Phytomonospora endophytica]MBB6037778.1 uncharacterized protein YukE [Phytomonospora endophytica]GIG67692.1 hypothetical protein Pen01_39870 [Phytomonospora endophytica]
MYGFEQASSIWMSVQPSGPATSAQSNWMAAAAEARQLADELIKNVQTLLSYWKGPAATEFSKSMQTLAGFAADLSADMTNMAKGLSQMAASAEAARAKAMVIIATHQHPKMRAIGAAKLNALMGTTGGQYNSAKSQYWQEPTQPPEKLPHKNSNSGETTPQGLDNPGTIPSKREMKDDFDLLDIIKPIADGLGFGDTDGPGGGDGDLDGFDPGPLPNGSLPPDDPSYNPVPIPDTNLEEPDPIGGGGAGMNPVGGSTGLAGATPAVPTTGLATNGGGMAPVGGGVGPMAGVMGGGGFAPRSGGGAPKTAGVGGGGGLFGPPMMGGGAQRRGEEEESGVHTWLTEDEMAWDGDAAPGAVTGRD